MIYICIWFIFVVGLSYIILFFNTTLLYWGLLHLHSWIFALQYFDISCQKDQHKKWPTAVQFVFTCRLKARSVPFDGQAHWWHAFVTPHICVFSTVRKYCVTFYGLRLIELSWTVIFVKCCTHCALARKCEVLWSLRRDSEKVTKLLKDPHENHKYMAIFLDHWLLFPNTNIYPL